MTQRIQAPANADLCLIISREERSVVPRKMRQRGGVRRKNRRGKIEGKRETRAQDLAEVTGRKGNHSKDVSPRPCCSSVTASFYICEEEFHMIFA